MAYCLLYVAILQISLSLVIDRPDSIVKGWRELKRTDPGQAIQLLFALKNENVDVLEKTLLDVSTPGNPQYGNHRDVASLYEMIAPSTDAVNTIKNWLFSVENMDQTKIIRETPNDDLWSIETDIQTAETLLDCQYYDYLSEIDRKTIVSRVKMGTNYQLDASIGKHLYFVSPTHRFPYLQTRLRAAETEINPTILKALYNVGETKGRAANNSQAIASFRDQYYRPQDLEALWAKYNISACNVTNVPESEPEGSHAEAELDTQYISSMGEKIAMQVWWTKGLQFEDALLKWTQDVLQTPSAAALFSVSYGGPETDFGASYIAKFNNQLMMMGASGISVLFASGDSGAGGGCNGNGSFVPDYPASSPYVTAVGGLTKGTVGGETVWIDGGGGFSNYAATPSWQKDAVSYYLSNQNDLPDSSVFNASGRGYPDVSAQAENVEIIVRGKSEGVSGTSCSSPITGGIMALLNDVRAQNGMSKLGFLNPLIYQTAASDTTAFNDVTRGYNKGCGVEHGFEAAAKWDPASGFGSPNYAVLAQKVLQSGRQTLKHRRND